MYRRPLGLSLPKLLVRRRSVRPARACSDSVAPLVIGAGYSALPIRVGEKRPALDDWDKLRATTLTPEQIARIARENPNAGLGVAGGFNGLTPIDYDTDNPEVIKAARAVLPPPLVTKKGRRGHTDFYRCTQGLILAKKFRDPEGMMLLEVLGSGQTVIPPTIHPETKLPYEWLTENTLLNTHVEELPLLDDDIIEQIERALAPHLPKPKVYVRPQANTHFVSAKSERMRSYALAALGGERRTLGSMPHRPSSRNRQLFIATWKVGKYVAHSVLTEAELRQDLMQAASSCGLVADDGPDACQATISSGLFQIERR